MSVTRFDGPHRIEITEGSATWTIVTPDGRGADRVRLESPRSGELRPGDTITVGCGDATVVDHVSFSPAQSSTIELFESGESGGDRSGPVTFRVALDPAWAARLAGEHVPGQLDCSGHLAFRRCDGPDRCELEGDKSPYVDPSTSLVLVVP